MAYIDSSVTGSFNEDRNDNVFIGLDIPFRKSNGVEGYFGSTSTTIEAIKNNIKNLLQTEKGERYLQPNLGVSFRGYMFEQITEDIIISIKTDIINTFSFWLPFVEIRNVNIVGSDTDIDSNILNINIDFSIKKDPNTLHSVQVNIGDGVFEGNFSGEL